jgi:hypothetical protein
MQSALYFMVGRRKPRTSTFGLHPFFFKGAVLVQKLKLNERGTEMTYRDVKPSREVRRELQKYVGCFTDSQRRLKECSIQRALNWLELYSNHYSAISDLSLTLEENPDQLCAVFDFLGVLIDLNIIHEFMKDKP